MLLFVVDLVPEELILTYVVTENKLTEHLCFLQDTVLR